MDRDNTKNINGILFVHPNALGDINNTIIAKSYIGLKYDALYIDIFFSGIYSPQLSTEAR